MSAPNADRVAQEGRRHRVVDDERHAVRVRDLGDGGDVEHAAGSGCRGSRRRRRAVVRPHRRGEGVGRAGVDEGRLDAELGEVDGEHADAAAVERAGGDDVVAVLRAASAAPSPRAAMPLAEAERGAAALERGDALLEHRDGRVRQPRIDVAEGLQVEQAGGVVGAVEDEARRLVDRQRARAGRGIGDLAGVDAPGVSGWKRWSAAIVESRAAGRGRCRSDGRRAEITPVFDARPVEAAEQARVLDLDAAVHDHVEAGARRRARQRPRS